MVKVLKIKKQKGQTAKRWLASKGWLSNKYVLGKTQRYLLIPVNESANTKEILKKFEGSIEKRNLQRIKKQKGGLKDLLISIIPKKDIDKLVASYDIVGDIVVLEIPKGLEKYETSIGWTVRRIFPNVKVVVKKTSITKGEYRVRKVKVISGEKRTKTIHIENGLKFKVDLNKAYFSSRLAGERLRIAKLVKPKERVLVMFCGIGIYPLIIAKVQPNIKEIVGVEINSDAIDYFKDNIRMNCKIYSGRKKPALEIIEEKIKPVLGDAGKFVPKLGKFDRIAMPLPKLAHEFLDEALKSAKKGAVIHFYTFVRKGELGKAKSVCKEAANKAKRKIRFIRAIKCGQYAPYVFRVCIDFKVD